MNHCIHDLPSKVFYTAFLTAIYLAMAVLMLVGSSQRWLMTSVGWLCVDCEHLPPSYIWYVSQLTYRYCQGLVLSAFTMQSSKRVVRRLDRDTILQHPAAWNSMYQAGLAARRTLDINQRAHRNDSSSGVTSRTPPRIVSDPFEDFQYDSRSTTSSSSLIHEIGRAHV